MSDKVILPENQIAKPALKSNTIRALLVSVLALLTNLGFNVFDLASEDIIESFIEPISIVVAFIASLFAAKGRKVAKGPLALTSSKLQKLK